MENMDVDEVASRVDELTASFSRLKQYAPGSISPQERYGYHILMKKLANVWSTEEDEKIIQLMVNQDETINYSSVCKYFPGKDQVHLRDRYLYLVKRMKIRQAFVSTHGSQYPSDDQVPSTSDNCKKRKNEGETKATKKSKLMAVNLSDEEIKTVFIAQIVLKIT